MTSQSKLIKMLTIIVTIYLFLLSIKLLGHSFKQFKDLAEVMIKMTSNPFAGLIIGIVATSLIQSSSTTTAIVVGLVAGNALSLSNAIPIIMGANIGTTVTNTLVSLGHIKSREEFRRAFSASIVHDFFNICVVIVLFPVEMKFHIIERTASLLKHGFFGAGGLKMFNPLKIVLNPAISWLDHIFSLLPYKSALMIVFSLLLMFASLTFLVKTIRVLMLTKMEVIIGNYLFRNDIFGFIFGILMTAIVQSSSVTTSLIIPLAGAGLVSVRQIFPYTLGANIGTTVTAILAAMATQNSVAITVAFSHLCFNIFGILLFYPLKFIPIRLALFVGDKAGSSTKHLILFITVYILLHFVPVALIFLT
ncbi:MAG: Na/Pi symporter [Candidatus Marinimicrobia bacterium]|nr:Na/Pi symporter [Candidatus Neomarinimicrobiota bacterium]MDP6593578.1 Na/Pi symporter [Candidatus Neomarinimicrobiota bacterium]MDP6836271.1 Na/Pi symporter [Candidatus Neomarinimicrobiota bacterium]